MNEEKVEFYPFFKDVNENLDIVYTFTTIKNNYLTKLTIDELNDSLLIKEECQCKGFFWKHVRCKHLKEALLILKRYGIEFREDSTIKTIEDYTNELSTENSLPEEL